MLGRVFRHGQIQRLGIERLISRISVRQLASSARACNSFQDANHPQRITLLEDHDHNVMCSPDSTAPTARPYGRPSGRHPASWEAGPRHRAFVAFGSNMGHSIGHIENALVEMGRRRVKIKSVSRLYETEPMYVTDQDLFLNGVCEVETDLDPLPLLDVLQSIENDLGRQRRLDKGPRNIDLDIVLYDSEQVSHERLQIPHKLMLEREFVLRPLADLIPDEHLPVPGDSRAIQQHLINVAAETAGKGPASVTVMSPHLPLLKATRSTRSTSVMAILNLTPDSFSDGNLHSTRNMENLEKTVKGFVGSGATIIDIGGQSTRPNADKVSPDHELERILPAIRQIKSMPEATNFAISVDTFYARVAEEAIAAGADIINDVTAGEGDPLMLATAARLQKTIILMHMRGTPPTMTQLTNYPDGVITGVGRELSQRVQAAKAAGILPWRIILDPGIGFAKTPDQNLELLRRLDELRVFKDLKNYPWLVGPSRKGFVGKITDVKEARDRVWGTAAAVTASIRGGADIVRVHDVAEMTQVAKMADAIFRVEDQTDTGRRPSQ